MALSLSSVSQGSLPESGGRLILHLNQTIPGNKHIWGRKSPRDLCIHRLSCIVPLANPAKGQAGDIGLCVGSTIFQAVSWTNALAYLYLDGPTVSHDILGEDGLKVGQCLIREQ